MTCWQEHRRANPENVSVGGGATPLICHMAAWVWGEMPFPCSTTSRPKAGENAGPEVTRVRELSATLPTSGNTTVSRPCTLLEHHNRASSIGGCGVAPAPKEEVSKGDLTPSFICHKVACTGERCPPLLIHQCLRQVGEPPL